MGGAGTGTRDHSSRAVAYAGALGAAILAYALRRALDPLLADHAPFITFYLAVVLVAWRWGPGPGALVTALGAVSVPWTYFAHQRTAETLWLLFYLLACGTMLLALHALARARDQAAARLEQVHAEIAERERAQRAEDVQRRWADATLASIGDAVLVSDPQGRVSFLNAVAETLTGWTREEARGRPVAEVFAIRREGTGEPVEIPVERVLREGRAVGLANHTELVARDGRVTSIDDSAAPIVDAQGTLLGVVLVFRDITERRRSEQALVRTNAELERFASVASHDLQEPLRTMAGFVGLLERKYAAVLDAEGREYIAFAVDGAKRMQQLVEDLLAYSRAGSQAPQTRPLPLDPLLDRVLAALRDPLEEAGAVVERDPLPVVDGDETCLGQVFQNLLSNALKFRGGRPARIEVRARRMGPVCEIEVRDRGIGFDPRHRERIFDMFQRLHGTDEYPGSGIGLAICKRIVEAHGGTIVADGAPGEGASFRLTLRAASAAEATGAAAGPEAAQA